METRMTPQESARLLMELAQVRRPKTYQAIWRWCKSKLHKEQSNKKFTNMERFLLYRACCYNCCFIL